MRYFVPVTVQVPVVVEVFALDEQGAVSRALARMRGSDWGHGTLEDADATFSAGAPMTERPPKTDVW